MKKAAVFLADGFEEIEAVATVDLLRRAGIDTCMAGVTGMECTGAHGVKISADMKAEDVDIKDFDAFICPGGGMGAENLKKSALVRDILKDGHKAGKLIAAICAAPIVLEAAGIMEGKNYTIYPAMKDTPVAGTYYDKDVVKDGSVITGAGPAATPAFAFALIEYLAGKDAADRVAAEALFKK